MLTVWQDARGDDAERVIPGHVMKSLKGNSLARSKWERVTCPDLFQRDDSVSGSQGGTGEERTNSRTKVILLS